MKKEITLLTWRAFQTNVLNPAGGCSLKFYFLPYFNESARSTLPASVMSSPVAGMSGVGRAGLTI